MDAGLFLDEWVGLIRGVWTEIPGMDASPTQLYTSVQALKQSFVEALKNGDLALPAVVLKFGTETQSDVGVATGIYRTPVSIFYIANALTPQATIHAKLVQLRNGVQASELSNSLTTFQHPPERGTIDTSDDNEVNANLAAEGIRVVAGSLSYSPGVFTFDQ